MQLVSPVMWFRFRCIFVLSMKLLQLGIVRLKPDRILEVWPHVHGRLITMVIDDIIIRVFIIFEFLVLWILKIRISG